MLRTHTAIACLLLTVLNQSSQAQTSLPPRTVVVQKGTVLKFATVAELSSATAKKGDRVPLMLMRPLVVDGITLLPAGAEGYGRITETKMAGPKCTQGYIEWEVDRVPFADASTALTEIYIRTFRPDTPVPESINSSEVQRGRHDDLEALPEIIVFLTLTSPFVVVSLMKYLIWSLFHRGGPSCPGNGSDYVFPAGSTVGVVIAKNHRVRY